MRKKATLVFASAERFFSFIEICFAFDAILAVEMVHSRV